jgi:hypothetical protein
LVSILSAVVGRSIWTEVTGSEICYFACSNSEPGESQIKNLRCPD